VDLAEVEHPSSALELPANDAALLRPAYKPHLVRLLLAQRLL
jgi:hypothetical protein